MNWGSSILYSPRIWQKGSLSLSLLHQVGRRVWLSSKILSIYASRICKTIKFNVGKEAYGKGMIISWHMFEILRHTVNSVTWMELDTGPNIPASLYIARIKATHVVDFPSLYTQSSCSGIVSSSSKGIPRFSVSTRMSCKSKS